MYGSPFLGYVQNVWNYLKHSGTSWDPQELWWASMSKDDRDHLLCGWSCIMDDPNLIAMGWWLEQMILWKLRLPLTLTHWRLLLFDFTNWSLYQREDMRMWWPTCLFFQNFELAIYPQILDCLLAIISEIMISNRLLFVNIEMCRCFCPTPYPWWSTSIVKRVFYISIFASMYWQAFRIWLSNPNGLGVQGLHLR